MYTNIGLPSYLLYLHWYLIILVLTKLSKNIMFELKYKLLKLYDILFCINRTVEIAFKVIVQRQSCRIGYCRRPRRPNARFHWEGSTLTGWCRVCDEHGG